MRIFIGNAARVNYQRQRVYKFVVQILLVHKARFSLTPHQFSQWLPSIGDVTQADLGAAVANGRKVRTADIDGVFLS
jgi:hypothetical protein